MDPGGAAISAPGELFARIARERGIEHGGNGGELAHEMPRDAHGGGAERSGELVERLGAESIGPEAFVHERAQEHRLGVPRRRSRAESSHRPVRHPRVQVLRDEAPGGERFRPRVLRGLCARPGEIQPAAPVRAGGGDPARHRDDVLRRVGAAHDRVEEPRRARTPEVVGTPCRSVDRDIELGAVRAPLRQGGERRSERSQERLRAGLRDDSGSSFFGMRWGEIAQVCARCVGEAGPVFPSHDQAREAVVVQGSGANLGRYEVLARAGRDLRGEPLEPRRAVDVLSACELDVVEHQARLAGRGKGHDHRLRVRERQLRREPAAALRPRMDEEIERDPRCSRERAWNFPPADVERPPRVTRAHVGERRAGRFGAVLRDEPATGVAEGPQDGEVGHHPEPPVSRDPRFGPFVARERARGERSLRAGEVARSRRAADRVEGLSRVAPAGAFGERIDRRNRGERAPIRGRRPLHRPVDHRVGRLVGESDRRRSGRRASDRRGIRYVEDEGGERGEEERSKPAGRESHVGTLHRRPRHRRAIRAGSQGGIGGGKPVALAGSGAARRRRRDVARSERRWPFAERSA